MSLFRSFSTELQIQTAKKMRNSVLPGIGRPKAETHCSSLLLIIFLCVRDVGADFCRTDELRWLTRPTSSGSSTYTSSGLAHIRLSIRRGSEPTTSLKSRHCFVKTSFFFTLHAFNSIRRWKPFYERTDCALGTSRRRAWPRFSRWCACVFAKLLRNTCGSIELQHFACPPAV